MARLNVDGAASETSMSWQLKNFSVLVPCSLGACLAFWLNRVHRGCYHFGMFNFGRPKSAGDWIAHVLLGVVALAMVAWMIRLFIV